MRGIDSIFFLWHEGRSGREGRGKKDNVGEGGDEGWRRIFTTVQDVGKRWAKRGAQAAVRLKKRKLESRAQLAQKKVSHLWATGERGGRKLTTLRALDGRKKRKKKIFSL